MNELLIILLALIEIIIFSIVILYMTADIILSLGEIPKTEVIILVIIMIFFTSLEYLLDSYTNLISHALVIIIAIYLYFFRKKIAKTFREMAELGSYLFRKKKKQEWDEES